MTYIEQGAHYIRKSLIYSARKAFLEKAVVELCQTAFMLACTISTNECVYSRSEEGVLCTLYYHVALSSHRLINIYLLQNIFVITTM